MNRIASNLQAIKREIAEVLPAIEKTIDLLAVSKGQSDSVIREAFEAGQSLFAENYLQEGLDKIEQLKDLSIEWHFIGPVQSNKTKLVATFFQWVHSVDRLKIAQRLSEARVGHPSPLNICVQVNVSGEDTKSGVTIDEAENLCKQVASLPDVRLRGLMTIGKAGLTSEEQHEQFRSMKSLFDRLNRVGLEMDTLSMGMSDDYKIAIKEGATMIRLGTAIFGMRKPKASIV
jgi:pyridoxal phosphate enzyme (YggS family)